MLPECSIQFHIFVDGSHRQANLTKITLKKLIILLVSDMSSYFLTYFIEFPLTHIESIDNFLFKRFEDLELFDHAITSMIILFLILHSFFHEIQHFHIEQIEFYHVGRMWCMLPKTASAHHYILVFEAVSPRAHKINFLVVLLTRLIPNNLHTQNKIITIIIYNNLNDSLLAILVIRHDNNW